MKFTAEKPTVPGAYFCRHSESGIVDANPTNFALDYQNKLRDHLGRCVDASWYEGYEWSERLVPVGEVQIAFVEGACAARHWSHLKPHELWDSGVKIRARRVVEGKEEV